MDRKRLSNRIVTHTDGREGGVCEDLSGAAGDTVWVLDGSSGATGGGYTDAASDGRWYVEAFDDYLTRTAAADEPLTKSIRQGIKRVTERIESLSDGQRPPTVERPLAAAAVLRLRGGKVEYFLSADCSLLVRRPDGTVERILGEGPRTLDASILEIVTRLKREEGLSHELALDRVRSEIVDARRQLNAPGGYWALSFDPRAVDHARASTLDVTNVGQLAIYSDGFERLVETYKEVTPRELFELVERAGVEQPFRRLRSIEAEDPNCERYPRLKPSDDAALTVVSLSDIQQS